MARKRAMSQKQQAEIRDLNKRLSKKKSNLKSRYGVVIDIPRIDTNLKGKELKAQVEKVQSFLNPHNQNYQYVKPNKYGVALPKKEVNQVKRFIKKVNKIKSDQRKKLMELDYTIQGEVVGKAWQVKYSNLSEMDEMIPLQFKPDWFTSVEDFRKWVKRKFETYGDNEGTKDFTTGQFLNKQRERYKDNYISAMYAELGMTNEVEKLANIIRGMDTNTFYFTSLSTDEGHIRYLYEARYHDGVLEEIAKVWIPFEKQDTEK